MHRLCIGMILCWFVGWSSAATVQVDVTQMQAGAWTVTYQLPAPVKRLYFYRVGALQRDAWQLSDPDLQLGQTDAGQDYVASQSGQAFTEMTIHFASDQRTTPKDYELNFAFSDGAELLYTGHLLVALTPEDKTEHQFTFNTAADQFIIVAGQRRQQQQQWLDQTLRGTYVYFGQQEPVQSDAMLGVIDPGLPAWVQQKLQQYLPQLFDYYAAKTGLSLDFTPVVYFTYRDSDLSGTQYDGGVLPGLIQLNLVGQDWQQETPENLTGLLHFLAHEAAHLWNAQLVMSDSRREHSWLHEGGADAFAVRALVHLGFWDANDARQAHVRYLNACLDDLQGHAITDHGGHQNFAVYYACGATLAWFSELALQAHQADTDLFDLWRDVMTRVHAKQLKLTPEQYFISLLQHSQNPAVMIHILTWLTEPHAQANEAMAAAFAAVGQPLKSQSQHPKQAKQAAASAFKHLMQQDCRGYSYHRTPQAYVVGEGLSCGQLKSGMAVTHIMGESVVDGGHAILEQVRRRCQSQQPITLQAAEQASVSVACQTAPAAIRPWLGLP
ncbi:hypothetical protein [Marinicella meishanensis]|uniref:hypothetical protein n=1 Tax=Marinicella meishanensis TaxID=2873263 RepID=UPI001CBC5015|nr:hypothetical protein [Marinicella sp. NBU2979]